MLAVRSALAQTLVPGQVLVLCDGCTDGTADAVAALGDPRAIALDLAKGPGYAYAHRNLALERAATDFVVYMGDDDLLLPDHLEQMAAVADGADLVCTPAVVVDPDDGLTWIGADWSVPEARERMETLANSNVMASVAIRAATARAAGGWDGAVERAGDWDLWRRATKAGARAVATDRPTVLHFKATGRDQPWPDRVAQNARWLALLEDPRALSALRPRLARTRYEHEARHAAELDRCRKMVAELSDELSRVHRAYASQETFATEQRTWIANAEALLAEYRDYIAELEATVEELRDP